MFHGVMRGLQGSDQQPDRNLVMHRERGAPVCTGKIQPFSLSILRASVSLFALVALPVLCGPLNDTGIQTCGDSTTTSTSNCTVAIVGDQGTFPRQDARYGLDAKQAGQGFSFTKISNSGAVLTEPVGQPGPNPTDWACTLDNVTGLLWEVKTSGQPADLRSQNYTYTWYNTDPASNGGDAGTLTVTSAVCRSSTGNCNTQQYVAEVNAASLCGHSSGWRLPTVKELEQIVDFSQLYPAIDTNYFPNTPNRYFWTSTLDSVDNLYAWIVDNSTGIVGSQVRWGPLPVRLVWGAAK